MEFYRKNDVVALLDKYAELCRQLALLADIRGDKTEENNMVTSAATIMAISDKIENELEPISIGLNI